MRAMAVALNHGEEALPVEMVLATFLHELAHTVRWYDGRVAVASSPQGGLCCGAASAVTVVWCCEVTLPEMRRAGTVSKEVKGVQKYMGESAADEFIEVRSL